MIHEITAKINLYNAPPYEASVIDLNPYTLMYVVFCFRVC